MTTKIEVANRDPSDQVLKVLDSLRVVKLALACRDVLDKNDLSAIEYTLLETISDLERVASLLSEHQLQWDGSLSSTVDALREMAGKLQEAA